MAEPELSVLLRNGAHDSTATNNTTRVRYALQCDNFSIQIAKTPIQIPIPQKSPELVDLGIFRPSISINGLIPTVGSGTATATGYEGMEFFSYTRGGNSNFDIYIPTFVSKNFLAYSFSNISMVSSRHFTNMFKIRAIPC